MFRSKASLFAGAFLAYAAGLAVPGKIVAAPANPLKDTYCNPIDIPYNFWEVRNGQGYREGADPDMVLYKGEFFLFSSHGGGYWWSSDMHDWHLVIPTGLDLVKYAPAVTVIGNTMYYTSSEGGRMYSTSDPKGGAWTDIWQGMDAGIANSGGDPNLFVDGDGRAYLINGIGPNGSIGVVELDPAKNLTRKGGGTTLIRSDTLHHGFENWGEENVDVDHANWSWFEAGYMRKHAGRYYLSYSAPGTELRSYGDGAYVSDNIKGPYTYLPNSPVCRRSFGFVTGTGHSATFQDARGKYWHVTTVVVSTIDKYERRLAIFPAYFDADGLFHVDTYLGDYPQFLPAKAVTEYGGDFAGAMLLSYGKAAAVSSTANGFPAANAFDENIKTWWSASTANAGEWLRVDLGRVADVAAIQTNFAEHKANYVGKRSVSFSHKFKIEGALSPDGPWTMLVDKSANGKDVPHDYSVLDSVTPARYVRITNAGPMPGGGTFAIRDFRVFGMGDCGKPTAAGGLAVARSAADPRMAKVSWNGIGDAEGYVIRYGIAPDKLYNHFQMLGKEKTSYDVRTLNVGVKYYFTVDAYSGCGIAKGQVVKADDNSVAVRGDRPPVAAGSGQGAVFPVAGNRFILPGRFRGKRLSVSVFDQAGKLLQRKLEDGGAAAVSIDAPVSGIGFVRIVEVR
jgi:hypothetical protein